MNGPNEAENEAAGYLRVSTEEQARGGVSLDAQDERVRAYCQLAGLRMPDDRLFREEGVSGTKPLATRERGAQLLELITAGHIKNVVAMKLDRLFRDAVDALNQTRSWDRAGVALHLVDLGGQTLNSKSAMGRMFLTLVAAFAELERNLISERTATALRHKREHGQVYSPTPLGFTRTGNTLKADAGEQRVIRQMKAWDARGWSYHRIARELTAKGIPTKRGGTWHASTVRYVLRNSLHAGAAA